VTTHSKRFGDQMATRSPVRTPCASGYVAVSDRWREDGPDIP